MKIWLVAFIIIGGEPIKLMDDPQPSVAICFQRAADILDRVTTVHSDDAYEFQVTCSIVKDGETPG